MKTYMPLNGLRWSRNSGSANCDMPQSAVFGRPGGGKAADLLVLGMVTTDVGGWVNEKSLISCFFRAKI